MAEMESPSDLQDGSYKDPGKTKTLNGHSDVEKESKSNFSDKMENGETECKSPQLNGDICDKSTLDNCELSETDVSCVDEKSDLKIAKDSLPKDANSSDSAMESVNNCSSSSSVNFETLKSEGENKSISEDKAIVSDVKSASSDIIVQTGTENQSLSNDAENQPTSVTKLNEIVSDNATDSESKVTDCENDKATDCEGKVADSDNDKAIDNETSKVVSENEALNSEPTIDLTKTDEENDAKDKEGEKETTEKMDCQDDSITSESKKEDKSTTGEIVEGDSKKADETPSEGDNATKDATDTKEVEKTPNDKVDKKETPKKKDEPKPEIVKRVTRSSSGISKPVKYVDPDPRDLSDEDDDDIRITKEVKKDDESDIEMIEESDPLAISDADVKKAKEASKVPPLQSRLKNLKQKDQVHKGKDQTSVIIIDTNTLLKGHTNHQQSSSVSHSVSKMPNSVSASAQTTGSLNTTTTNIQTAIQAITGGNPAIQGLQSAYLSAIQQVLVAQGGNQVSNPHYIATLQQYYNTLGALQDDAYVIEAPSFIVPYVMEGKPTESIKDYLLRIQKEIDAEEKKRENEQKKKELEEKKKNEEKAKEEAAAATEAAEEKKKEEDKKEDEPMEVDEEEDQKKDEDVEMKDEEEDKEKKADEETEKKVSIEGEKAGEGENEDSEAVGEEEEEEKETAKKLESTEAKDAPSKSSDAKSLASKEVVDVEDKEEKDKSKTKEEVIEDDDKENKADGEEVEEVIDLDKEVEKEDLSHLGRWEGYYRSALGKFFMELGLNHVQEFIQADLLRMQKRRMDKLKSHPSREDVISIKSLERQLNVSRQRNAHLHLGLKMCKFCSFKAESTLVMERHLESPHMINYTYKCNFCEFETRGPQVILFHTEAEHNVRGRLERAPAFFQCPLCPFEDNNKSKMTRHSFSCTKKFKADRNCDLADWEPPAKIPKIHRGRPNASTFGKTFDALKMPNILPKNLGALGLNLQNAISSGLLNSTINNAVNASTMAGRGRGRPVGSYKNITQAIGGSRSGSLLYQNRGAGLLQPMQGVSSAQQLSIANQVLQSVTQGAASARVPRILPASSAGSILPGLAASSSITIQSVQNKSGNTKSPQQPSISITPLPRGGTQSSGSKPASTTVSTNNTPRPAFVICEICDGYIKDLEQLRNHMNLIHKVKIHPKMIYNRPPLNCQKCQHRFFTDQGLERHLLGTHGLVTSSMQEAANKGKDAGRCPICGKVFQWKLLNHVSRDHKMTLKPAHLSYKCTVCTATFNMYRLFENHVYSAHSVVNKNKNNETSSTTSTAPVKKTVTGSDTPLKINDEITIIPQPATKTPKTDSKSSPKKSDSPSMGKEITITKVGSRTSRRSGGSAGGGVEVISLDDSPQKRQSEEPPKKRTRETATSKRARTST